MGGNPTGRAAAERIVAIREKWHTKNHPFFIEFSEGKIGLDALGTLMAQHYQHVSRVQPSLGVVIYKAPGAARKFMVETLAEEEGVLAGEGEGREAHDHMDLIFRFCAAAGLSRDRLRDPGTELRFGKDHPRLHRL